MENKAKEENIEQQQSVTPKKKVNVFSIIKVIWKIVEKIIMLAIVLISAIIITQRVTDNEKAFLGYRIFRVETGSMIPVYEVGDVIIIKETETDQIAIGDDVTYWGTSGAMKRKIVTHRVIGIEEYEGEQVFRTRGVANTADDPLVHPSQINGVVQAKMKIITTIVGLLSNQYIFYFGAILPLTIYIFFMVIKANIKRYNQYK